MQKPINVNADYSNSLTSLISCLPIHMDSTKYLEYGLGMAQIQKHHNQIDYVMVRKHFQSAVNVAKTQSFSGADIGSDHDLVMAMIRMQLKKLAKCKQACVCFNLEKLKDSRVTEEFQATVRDKLAPLIMEMNTNNDIGVNTVTSTFNPALIEASYEVLELCHPRKKPWITAEILAQCDKKRKMKKLKSDSEDAKQYKKINKII